MNNKQTNLLNDFVELIENHQKSKAESIPVTKDKKYYVNRYKHTLGALNQTMQVPYNQQAFFLDPALDKPIINCVINPLDGLISYLPAFPSNFSNYKRGFITKFDTSTEEGTEQNYPCDNPLTINENDAQCKMRFPFGRYSKKTHTAEMDVLVDMYARGIYSDFYFLGDLRGQSSLPTVFLREGSRDLITEGSIRKAMQRMAINFQNWLSQMLWSGDPTNNTANGGYKEFLGLNTLINGNYGADPVLANYLETNTQSQLDCALLSSDVKDFGGRCVGDLQGGATIWEYMQELESTLSMRASMSGHFGVSHYIVMHPVHWYELTKVLPCMMAGDGCTGGIISVNDGNNGTYNVTMRQRLQETKIIIINGKSYEVITDALKPHVVNPLNNEITSSISFIPKMVSGEVATYLEYNDYTRLEQEFQPLAGELLYGKGWSDAGRYLLVTQFVNYCMEVIMKFEPRVILAAPQLAGEITNVIACPLQSKPTPVI